MNVGTLASALRLGDDTEQVSLDLSFSASASEDAIIQFPRRRVPRDLQIREVIQGRLRVLGDPGAAFEQYATYTFYNRSRMLGEDAFYRTQAKLVYDELNTATTGSDTTVDPDDRTAWSPNDLMLIDETEYGRIASIAANLTMEDIPSAYAVNTGLVRVSEFSGFTLWTYDTERRVYLRVTWGSAQTVDLRMDLILRVI